MEGERKIHEQKDNMANARRGVELTKEIAIRHEQELKK